MEKKLVVINENGYPIGESHHKARLSDAQVEQIRDLYEEGLMSYRAIARIFDCSRNTIKDICKYRRRNSYGLKYKTVYYSPSGEKLKPTKVNLGKFIKGEG